MSDQVIAHKNVFVTAKILHRDVGPANLFLAESEGHMDHRINMKNLSAEARDRLCKRIQSLTRRGVLGDWGYAVPVVPSESLATTKTSTTEAQVDAPPVSPSTSPIEGNSELLVNYDNRVPTRKIGSHDGPTLLLSASELTNEQDITLWMGTDNPNEDPRRTIDLCPLYRTVR